MTVEKIGIGLVGLGTVGSGLVEIIEKKNQFFKKKYNLDLTIKGVSAKSKIKRRSFDVNKFTWFQDPLKMVDNADIKIIVELIGGSDGLALELAKKTLKKGKFFVTANKALIAKHGLEMLKLSKKFNSQFSFEAAVGGGIPIIRVLQNSIIIGKTKNIYGILNGTCNYILTKMREKNISFKKALKDAQSLGFAEADPFDDISGTDTAYKLSILSNLVFNLNSDSSNIYKEGIQDIEEIDIKMSESLGYRIQLLGIANLKNNKVMQRVHPTLVPLKSMLSKVNNELNTVIIDDEYTEKIMIVGKGAGKDPTAASVMTDILNISSEKKIKNFSYTTEKNKKPLIQKIDHREGKFYIRMGVEDKPGVLADITLFFKKKKISIRSMFQLDKKINNLVPLIFITHKATEKKVNLVLKKMKVLDIIKTKIILFRIEDLL